jgi:hypothetical protein
MYCLHLKVTNKGIQAACDNWQLEGLLGGPQYKIVQAREPSIAARGDKGSSSDSKCMESPSVLTTVYFVCLFAITHSQLNGLAQHLMYCHQGMAWLATAYLCYGVLDKGILASTLECASP